MAKRTKRRRSRRPLPIYPISVQLRTMWRSPITGRRTSPPRPGQRFAKGTRPKREISRVQVDKKGRVVRTVEMLTSKKVIKTSIADAHGSVDAPYRPGTLHVFGSGDQGLIDPALANTNVWTKLKGAKRITMVVQGRDPRGRKRTITKQMFTVGVRNVRDMMVRGILDALREKGYRTQYTLSLVDWSKLKPDTRAGVRINSRKMVSALTPLDHLDIQITLEK